MFRFFVTGEFSDPAFAWTDNASWFDVKLLVNPKASSSNDYTKPMKTNTYARGIKSILEILALVVTHFAHLGRQLGAKILEMLEVESEEIRRLGNWNPSMQDACYSTKLPMKPIRRLAGYTTSGGIYYNKRTVVEVPESLQRDTPIGHWVFDALEKVKSANAIGGKHYTAQNFLEFLVELNIVFLQDIAVMCIEHPDRVRSHQALEQLPVLHSLQFTVRSLCNFQHTKIKCLTPVHGFMLQSFVETMQAALHHESSPLDATLETVLPGVHERLDAQRKATEDLHILVEKFEGNMRSAIQHVRDETLNRLEIELHRMFRRINGNGSENEMEIDRSVTGTSGQDGIVEKLTNSPSASIHRPFMPITYRNLEQLHNHWVGGGEYEHVYPGGIQTLEAEMGAKWRCNWKNAANKRLSKVKAIILAIENESKVQHQPVSTVLADWEDIYSGICKGKISNFHGWVVEQGKVQVKKARGKSATE